MVEEDLLVNAKHLSRLLDIVDDQVSLSNGSVLGPVSPCETESVQIGIRAKSRVFEQAPGATDFVSAFKDDVAEFRVTLLKAVGAIDARYSRTDDNYIVVEDIGLCGHSGGKIRCKRSGRSGQEMSTKTRPRVFVASGDIARKEEGKQWLIKKKGVAHTVYEIIDSACSVSITGHECDGKVERQKDAEACMLASVAWRSLIT